MANARFCAFNKTRGIILSLDVAVIDAAMDPLRVLRVLMEGLSSEEATGLWITHFRAVPVARAVSPFDLVYLDASQCVVHAVSLTVDSGFEPFAGEPSSALVLPASIITSSQTQNGDQFVVVAAPEADRAHVSTPQPVALEQSFAASIAASPVPHFPSENPADATLSRYLSGQAHQLALTPSLSTTTSVSPAPIAIASPAAPVATPPVHTPYPVIAQPAIAVEPEPAPPIAPENEAPPVSALPAVEYYRAPLPTFRARVLRWLRLERPAVPDPPHRRRDRRRAYRLNQPDLVAYFFTGGPPRPHRIQDISVTGFCMQSSDLWVPGTVIRMTLQRIGSRGDKPGDAITVHSRMVRNTPGGGAFEFVLSGFLDAPSRHAAS